MDESIPGGDQSKRRNTNIDDRQRRSLQPLQDTEVHAEKPTYRAPFPLPPTASPVQEINHQHNSAQGEPSRCPNETAPDEYDPWMEDVMGEYLQNLINDQSTSDEPLDAIPILDMTEEQLRMTGLDLWTLK